MLKRGRPIKNDTDKSKHSMLRKRWRSWLPHLKDDLSDLLGSREIFWELQDIAKENQNILNPGAFFDWMCRNYIVSIAVGARRFTDQHHKSRSLWRMLYQILENPGVINRSAHITLYTGISKEMNMGNLTFDNVVGEDKKYLMQNQIRADLRKIEDANERVRKFVNKKIAHHASPKSIRRLPTFNELDFGLDTIDKILCKYTLLLTAVSPDSMHATRQDPWTEVLKEAWVKPGSKFYPDIY